MLPPGFYNQVDKDIYAAGDFFIPQERFRAAPYTVNQPTNPDEVPAGIPAVYQAQGGDGGFNPYNTDMSKVRQDYNAFPSRQAGEIYSKTFNPQGMTASDASLMKAQNAYKLASNALVGGPSTMRLGNNVISLKDYTPGQLESLKTNADDFIQDAKMRYATEGQYVDPYDPRYSSVTEAQKFMDNYPDYYGVPSGVPEPGIPGAIKSYMQNSLLGKGFGMAKDFLGRVMPINERAIMENEARGAGIFTDDIGRIVTDDYNTAGGIMAGYNLNKIDAGTFDKRRSTIEKTIANKKAKGLDTTTLEERLGLLDDAEAQILGARKKTKQIYKMKADKKAADKKRKKEEKAAEAAAKNTGGGSYDAPGGVTSSNYNQAANIAGGGGGNTATYGGQTAREATYDNDKSTGTSQGYSQHYMDGGRVYYMDGGLADMLEIYD